MYIIYIENKKVLREEEIDEYQLHSSICKHYCNCIICNCIICNCTMLYNKM